MPRLVEPAQSIAALHDLNVTIDPVAAQAERQYRAGEAARVGTVVGQRLSRAGVVQLEHEEDRGFVDRELRGLERELTRNDRRGLERKKDP